MSCKLFSTTHLDKNINHDASINTHTGFNPCFAFALYHHV